MSNLFDQQYIVDLLNSKTEESVNLDFKRSESLDIKDEKKKKEIAKDVSSFANSDGGIIIYGIAEVNHKADSCSFVDGNEITKERLEHIINSRIQRKIEGLRIHPIRYDNKITQSIYIVEIPPSPQAPHMTSEKRFYKRYNFESVAMEEYEIRNLYSRKSATLLKLEPPEITGSARVHSGDKVREYRAKVGLNVRNIGQSIEERFKLEVRIAKELEAFSRELNPEFDKYIQRTDGNFSVISIPNSSPLFQNEQNTLAKITLKFKKHHFQLIENEKIRVKLFFSNGTEESEFSLKGELQHKEKLLTQESFY